jgi:beta-lactamase regulating signal transducer with metallopeptidase domain
MLLLIAYLLLVSCLLSVAALAAEQALARWQLPRRIVWMAALLLSVGWPTYAVLNQSIRFSGLSDTAAPPDVANRAAPLDVADRAAPPDVAPADVSEQPSTGGTSSAAAPPTDLNWSRWTGLRESFVLERAGGGRLDSFLLTTWIVSSALILALYVAASIVLRLWARHWQAMKIDASEVLISDGLGPATFGFIRPRIVFPRWLVHAEPEILRLVLRHENEHIAARDQVLLTAAMLLVLAAPWNPFLWLQLSRLRLAVETDCDTRVLRRDADAAAYARALLTVGQRRSAAPVAAVALMEPASSLEQRIRRFLNPPQSSSVLVFAACIAASSLVAAATIADAPLVTGNRGADGISADASDSGGDDMNARALIAAAFAATGLQAAELDTAPPEGWAEFIGSGPALGPGWQGLPRSCQAGVDTQLAAAGQANMSILCPAASQGLFASARPGFNGLNQRFAADAYRGKRVRFSAYLRTQGIADVTVPGFELVSRSGESTDTLEGMGGLFFRVGENVAKHLVRDDMSDRGLRGNVEWARYEIVADVPEIANGIVIGFWMQGQGQIWMSDVRFEEVSKDVPLTTQPFEYSTTPANLNLR